MDRFLTGTSSDFAGFFQAVNVRDVRMPIAWTIDAGKRR
jgi:hypothetical protein